MVRPRFARLPQAQQDAILRAAVEEFATRGFYEASLNRVVDAAGISKGSMYYYFDGKEDLYAYVAEDRLTQLFAQLGPFPVPDAADAETFWSVIEGYYLRVVRGLEASPLTAGLLRGWVATMRSSALQQAEEQLLRAVGPWIERTLAAGQRVGAVRDDLPGEFLVAMVVGMGQAMDAYVLTRTADDALDLADVVRTLVGMMRGALRPDRAD